MFSRKRASATLLPGSSSPTSIKAGLSPEQLWDTCGPSLYALARWLLVDTDEAQRALVLAVDDVYRQRPQGPDGEGREPLRFSSQSLLHRCRRGAAAPVPTGHLGAGDDAQADVELHRAAYGLCAIGGHDYREAALALEMTPSHVAALLRTPPAISIFRDKG